MNSKSTKKPVIVMAPGVLAGAEKVVLTGTTALLDQGASPLIVIIQETRNPTLALQFQAALSPDIESLIVETDRAFDLKLPKKIKTALGHLSTPYLLHSHGFKALIACFLMKGKNTHLHTHHGNTGHTLKVRGYEFLANLIMRTCDKVIAVSKKMKTDFANQLLPIKNVVVIDNMLSFSNIEQIKELKINKNPHEKIHLIYVGRISPEKGLLNFLHIFSDYSKRDQFQLTILGDGPDKTDCEDLVIKNNLSDSIRFHGFVKDPSSFLSKADLLLLPSFKEGLPMTLIEALCVGIPAIASQVGAIDELVTHQSNGVLIKNPNDKKEWIEALDFALSSLPLLAEHAQNDSKTISEKFSAKNWAIKTIELYQLTN